MRRTRGPRGPMTSMSPNVRPLEKITIKTMERATEDGPLSRVLGVGRDERQEQPVAATPLTWSRPHEAPWWCVNRRRWCVSRRSCVSSWWWSPWYSHRVSRSCCVRALACSYTYLVPTPCSSNLVRLNRGSPAPTTVRLHRRVPGLIGALSSSPVHRAFVLVLGTNIAVVLDCSKRRSRLDSVRLSYLLTSQIRRRRRKNRTPPKENSRAFPACSGTKSLLTARAAKPRRSAAGSQLAPRRPYGRPSAGGCS